MIELRRRGTFLRSLPVLPYLFQACLRRKGLYVNPDWGQEQLAEYAMYMLTHLREPLLPLLELQAAEEALEGGVFPPSQYTPNPMIFPPSVQHSIPICLSSAMCVFSVFIHIFYYNFFYFLV
jgi:hypothetical protein